jgi:tetratricopeptide (TPR) repeat protein
VLRWAIETILLAAATAATLCFYHDPGLKALFAVDYYSRQGLWSRVLDTARRAPPHYLICHAVDRALYHTGRLGDEMFAYYQDPRALLLTGKEALWQKADTCADLGLMNEAESALSLSLNMFGEKPLLLQRLARIYLVKGDTETASVYFRALSKVPFWRRQATEVLAQLQYDPNLAQVEEIQHLRAVRLRQDFVRPADVLQQLLVENPKNRMAYEYNMAGLLLTKNLAGFVQMFNTYPNAVESRIPRHYEEAILLCQAFHLGVVNLGGRSVSQESRNRFTSFMKALEPFGRDVGAARKALWQGFGDSYYYYFCLSGSGVQ